MIRYITDRLTNNSLTKVLSLTMHSIIYAFCFFIPLITFDVFNQTSAEIYLAAYEALSFALKASVPVISSSAINCIQDMSNSSDPVATNRPFLDSMTIRFLNHINGFLAVQQLARTRRAALMTWKVFPYVLCTF